MLKKLWHDPVWSKVIASAIVAALSVGFYFFGGWKFFKSLLQIDVNIPFWMLIVFFIFLSAFFMILIHSKKEAGTRRILIFVPLHWQRWWHLAKQQDGSFCSQIALDVQVSNSSNNPVQIVKLNLIKPKAKLVSAQVMLPMKGSPYHSHRNPVPPCGTAVASMHLMARGELAAQGHPICITLGVIDQYGHEYKIKNIVIETRDKIIPTNHLSNFFMSFKNGIFRVMGRRCAIDDQNPIKPWQYNPDLESIDTCEAILTEEQRNYAACGRIRGGLGSLNVGIQSEPNYGCTELGNVPTLLWKKDEGKRISSPNLERLINYYEALNDLEKDNLSQYLLNHLDRESPFADVAYFIFLALHRFGKTIDALKTARTFLAGDKVFGYSNLLGTLSAIISHEHFSIESSLFPKILHVLEGDQEHDFWLREKINLAKLERLM